jgi:hypothetical protein
MSVAWCWTLTRICEVMSRYEGRLNIAHSNRFGESTLEREVVLMENEEFKVSAVEVQLSDRLLFLLASTLLSKNACCRFVNTKPMCRLRHYLHFMILS